MIIAERYTNGGGVGGGAAEDLNTGGVLEAADVAAPMVGEELRVNR